MEIMPKSDKIQSSRPIHQSFTGRRRHAFGNSSDPHSPIFSIATNVSIMDAPRITCTLPHWLRTFRDLPSELLIIVDKTPPGGRIAALHKILDGAEELCSKLRRLELLDSRIRIVEAVTPNEPRAKELSSRWFKYGTPFRCQAGTPILAFIQAIEDASTDLILRCDCDMLFSESGWLCRSLMLVDTGEVDLVEPSRLGINGVARSLDVSTRAFLLHRTHFRERILPIKPHSLDICRRIHRYLHRRPAWLALEQMLQIEKSKATLRHLVLSDERDGFSMHVARRQDFLLTNFSHVVSSVETASIPDAQRRAGWNFTAEAWAQFNVGQHIDRRNPERPGRK